MLIYDTYLSNFHLEGAEYLWELFYVSRKHLFHRKKDDLWAVDLIMTSRHVFDVSLFLSLLHMKPCNEASISASYLVNMGKHNGQQP